MLNLDEKVCSSWYIFNDNRKNNNNDNSDNATVGTQNLIDKLGKKRCNKHIRHHLNWLTDGIIDYSMINRRRGAVGLDTTLN